MKRYKVIVADDNNKYRSGLVELLNSAGYWVQAEAKDGQEAIELVSKCRPDVVLMDLQMPILNGVEAIEAIKRKCPQIRVIALTTFDDDDLVFGALNKGASGYLLKGTSVKEISNAIQSVMLDQVPLAASVTKKIIDEFTRLSRLKVETKELGVKLSKRELEVLRCISRGMNNIEASTYLSISIGTIKNHLVNIYAKLGVSNRTEAALIAREKGII